MERLLTRELMDDDEAIGTSAQWQESLCDLARVNTYLGGWGALRAEIMRLPRVPSKLIDVATGGADLPRRLLEYLASRGAAATCVAVDRSARILQLAQSLSKGSDGLVFLQADAERLPFPDGTFDLAMMNLALHHFEPDAAVKVLRELARIATTVIVNDLRRSRIAWAFARFVFPIFTGNRFTRNDGPLSVLRAYTPPELRELAGRAGWRVIEVRTHPGYRMTLTGGVA
jgi:ubiquinone/menaquinone biosynthesis C-methylase UbiE